MAHSTYQFTKKEIEKVVHFLLHFVSLKPNVD